MTEIWYIDFFFVCMFFVSCAYSYPYTCNGSTFYLFLLLQHAHGDELSEQRGRDEIQNSAQLSLDVYFNHIQESPLLLPSLHGSRTGKLCPPDWWYYVGLRAARNGFPFPVYLLRFWGESRGPGDAGLWDGDLELYKHRTVKFLYV